MASSSRRRKIPVLRFALLVFFIWFLFDQSQSGWLAQYWERQSQTTVPPPDSSLAPLAPVDSSWKSWCESRSGTPFTLKKKMAQCSWVFSHRESVQRALAGVDVSSAHRLSYIAEVLIAQYPLQIHWVANQDSFSHPLVLDIQNRQQSIRLLHIPADSMTSSVWIQANTGCAFPGPCPMTPLEGGVIPIPAHFDFEGREHLLSRDQFQAIGESPVFAVLPGQIQSVTQDSNGYSVELYHGQNIYSRSSGLARLYPEIQAGAWTLKEEPLGHLSSLDTATFQFELIRNGKFVRWSDFWKESHPLSAERIATFRKSIGY